MTHTEIVHILFGAGITMMGFTALVAWWRPRSPARFMWPVMVFLIGFFLFIPVESGTRTYAVSGWWATFIDAFPDWGEHWSFNLSMRHIIQHKLTGLIAMMIGAVEFGQAMGWLKRPFWGRLLPVFSIAAGLFIAIHGGTPEHLPHRVEQVQHWILGSSLVVAGIVLALVQAGRLRGPVWFSAWPVIVMLGGLDLVFFYRL